MRKKKRNTGKIIWEQEIERTRKGEDVEEEVGGEVGREGKEEEDVKDVEDITWE